MKNKVDIQNLFIIGKKLFRNSKTYDYTEPEDYKPWVEWYFHLKMENLANKKIDKNTCVDIFKYVQRHTKTTATDVMKITFDADGGIRAHCTDKLWQDVRRIGSRKIAEIARRNAKIDQQKEVWK